MSQTVGVFVNAGISKSLLLQTCWPEKKIRDQANIMSVKEKSDKHLTKINKAGYTATKIALGGQ